MALTKTTQIANRYGLNLVFHKCGEEGTTNDVSIAFANEVSIEVTGDAVYATGTQAHKRLIGFSNPLEGSMTISTQIITPELLKLVAGDKSTTLGSATFKSGNDVAYYKVTGTTVWKDKDGTTYDETVTAYRCVIKPNYNVVYTGDGDPQSIDINLELLEDDEEGMITFAQADAA